MDNLPRKPRGALRRSPEASAGFRRDLDEAAEAGIDVRDLWIKQELGARGLPWTRENYIRQKYSSELPEEWDESDLPKDLQVARPVGPSEKVGAEADRLLAFRLAGHEGDRSLDPISEFAINTTFCTFMKTDNARRVLETASSSTGLATP